MTLLTGLIVTLTVWAVSAIRSVRRRSLVYSLPLPITLVLVTTRIEVDGTQLLGVLLLSVFFAVVAGCHVRLRLPVMVADLAGIAVYIALSAGIARLAPIPFWPVLAIAVCLWLLGRLLAPPRSPDTRDESPRPAGIWMAIKLVTVFGAALLMVGLTELLKGLIVTFPYSGVLVAIETKDHLEEFALGFGQVCISLMAFFTGYFVFQSGSKPLALGAAWAAFGLSSALLHLGHRHDRRRTGPPRRSRRPAGCR